MMFERFLVSVSIVHKYKECDLEMEVSNTLLPYVPAIKLTRPLSRCVFLGLKYHDL